MDVLTDTTTKQRDKNLNPNQQQYNNINTHHTKHYTTKFHRVYVDHGLAAKAWR